MITFSEYQQQSRLTAIYPDIGLNIAYPTLGLVGEAGEVAEKVKKILRDCGGQVREEHKEQISKELGDVLWYLSQVASEFELSLEEVAKGNLRKLLDRQARGKLGGSGDNR